MMVKELERYTYVITVLNEKGGCGKTTSVIQLAYYLARNNKVLLIDTDKTASSTIHLTGRADHKYSTYDLLKSEGDLSIRSAAVQLPPNWGTMLLIPGDRRLTSIEQDMTASIDRDRILKRVLDSANHVFDYIIIDTPPVLGIETRNALIASTHYLLVTDLSQYSEIGVASVRLFAKKVRAIANPNLTELGLLLTGYEKGNANSVKDSLGELMEDEKFLADFVIPHSVKVLEAQRQNKALGDAFPSSPVAKKYEMLANHFMETLQ